MPRIARIEGRSAEAIWIKDPAGRQRPLPGVLLHDAIDALPGIREWRATQTAVDRIGLELQFLRGAGRDIDVPALVTRLRGGGLPEGVKVTVRTVAELRPDRSMSKLRRIIPRVAPNHAGD
ncbi:hypothetical protein EBR04_00680 [bacterium]|nr:hypothetical protein [bacterium]